MAHSGSQQGRDAPGVAFDVASSATWSGQANPDARYFCNLEVAELPWPLRFAFIRAVDDDGSERWACTGVEIGRPIYRGEEGLDTETFELTAARFRHINDNYDRYRMMAERRLIPTPENLEHARRIRRGMKRTPGEPWTTEALALLVADWRALEGAPRGRMWALVERWGIDRSAVHRALDRAEAESLMQPGERRHRSD